MLDAISIDCVIFSLNKGQLEVLLVKHAEGISKGNWGLPGGWIYRDESIDDAAYRLLKDLSGLENVYLEQLRAFGDVKRFPGERVVTVAYCALIRAEDYPVVAGFTASDVKWQAVAERGSLIYDHDAIVDFGVDYLKAKIKRAPIGFNLLSEKFTLLQLQELYEGILGIKLDKPNFRRKMMKMNLLVDCNEKQTGVPHRAAQLYRFDAEVYQRLTKDGFVFEV